MSKAAGTRFLAVALAATALLAVCGCGGDSATETASGPSSASTTGKRGETPQDKSAPSQDSEETSSSRGDAGKEAPASAPADTDASKQGTSITAPQGPREPEATPKQRAEATVASISLFSPSLEPGPESTSVLPTIYTCDGRDSWPQLNWTGVPPDTAELALFAMNVEPVDEKLFFDWAVAGLDPDLEGLEAGRLPQGSIVGRNSFGKNGYSICPSAGAETYIFVLYALPSRLGAQPGFDPLTLRKEILAVSGNAGLLAMSYQRG